MQQVKDKRFLHCPSVAKMLENHAGAADVLKVHKYCDLQSKLGQQFTVFMTLILFEFNGVSLTHECKEMHPEKTEFKMFEFKIQC